MTDDGCGVLVQIGPTVITDVTFGDDRPPGPVLVPFPEGSWFTVDTLALLFGVPKNSLYVLLHRHKDDLGPPVYQRIRSSRRPRRWRRIVSEQDYAHLRTLFPVAVGWKPRR